MKKIFSLLLLGLFLTGCMEVETKVTLGNDDTGTIFYRVAIEQNDDLESDDELESPFEKYPGAEVKELEYEKNGKIYKGFEAIVPFNSLEELNDILSDGNVGEDDADDIVFTREDNKVTASSQSNIDGYEEAQEFLEALAFELTIVIEGEIESHNADEADETTNTLTWYTESWFRDGIKLSYVTDGLVEVIPEGPIPIEEEEVLVPLPKPEEPEESFVEKLNFPIIGGVVLAIGAGFIIYKKMK